MPKKKKDKYRFVFYRNHKGKQNFSWRVVACNGNIICSAEMYSNAANPKKTVKNLINAIKKGQFRIDDEINEVYE